jgi:predicted acyltransferase
VELVVQKNSHSYSGAPENGSLAYAICVITFMWFICWWMDKKKIYVKV